MSVIRELVQRADSWVNAMTGLGTLRDKLMHAQVVAGTKLQDTQLESLFNDDDVARRVVAKLPREATRRGFRLELEGDPDETAPADIDREMMAAFAKLEAMQKLRDGWIWGRLYGGGSGIFVGADDGLPVEEPLDESRIRTIGFLNVVKRPQLSVAKRYEDLQLAEYGKPELYNISQASGALAPREGLVVHESRLILFDGALTARMTQESPTGFDDSVLQSTFSPLQQTATAWQSVAHLLTDASQGVLKIANLVDLVAAGGQDTLRSRIQLMDLARSVCRAILVDAEKESFERVATSFAGLPEVMDKLMMRMSAAAEQPVTLLYGRSPAGMNATGDADIRGWYDTVQEGQADELKPRLERLIRLMFLAKDSPTRGVEPKSWCIEFNPLWQPTDKEAADTKKVIADTYVALVTGNVMTDAEAGIGLAPDFPTIDVESRTELAEADKEEGVRPREVNTPEPPALPTGDEPPEDGGGGGGSKPRGDGGEPREDTNQPRLPAGAPGGGRWTSGGGGGGGARGAVAVGAAAASGGALTDGSGKNAAVVALQQKLVQRYGVPLEKAALMWERDIKLQQKAAKAQRAGERAEKLAAKQRVTEALGKSLTAMNKAVSAKNEAVAKKTTEAAAKKTARNEKARATRAANKAKKEAEAKAKREAEAAAAKAKEAEAAKAREAEAAKAKVKEPEPPKVAAGPTVHEIADITSKAGLTAGREATTRLVSSYLDGAERLAPRQTTGVKDLSKKGWYGYNEAGHIVLDKKVAERLTNGLPEAARNPAKLAEMRARRDVLDREQLVLQSKHPRIAWHDPDKFLTKGDKDVTPKAAQDRYKAIRREVQPLNDTLHAVDEHRKNMATLVHEEFHSFGPVAKIMSGLYTGSGKVAEEVTTEVLAREVVYGSEARARGFTRSYQTQIDGVLDAVAGASTNKARGREHHYETVVKASKSFKQETDSASAMVTFRNALHKHDPELDADKLGNLLFGVEVPGQKRKRKRR